MSDIIEAAFNALWSNTRVANVVLSPTLLYALAEKVTAAVTPLILERAAKVAMDHPGGSYQVAAAIRALISPRQPPPADSA